ncbi:MAG: SDR family NAD(P)-dependent oxidoreductase [Gammaproteobacteria bacterium]|nr:SDR family NAD(P)-dependent oxidoreductase [Gammaproteobacteria bacterium]
MSYKPFDLNGKKAMVTGAAAGLGKACALGLAKAGADVAVIDIQDELGEQVAADIRELGREAFYLHCNVTDHSQVGATVKAVYERFGRLDIAHNNAGGGVGGAKSADDGAPQLFRQVVELDLLSVFYCCHEQAKLMIPKVVDASSIPLRQRLPQCPISPMNCCPWVWGWLATVQPRPG